VTGKAQKVVGACDGPRQRAGGLDRDLHPRLDGEGIHVSGEGWHEQMPGKERESWPRAPDVVASRPPMPTVVAARSHSPVAAAAGPRSVPCGDGATREAAGCGYRGGGATPRTCGMLARGRVRGR
jgi:hypothetical protein